MASVCINAQPAALHPIFPSQLATKCVASKQVPRPCRIDFRRTMCAAGQYDVGQYTLGMADRCLGGNSRACIGIIDHEARSEVALAGEGLQRAVASGGCAGAEAGPGGPDSRQHVLAMQGQAGPKPAAVPCSSQAPSLLRSATAPPRLRVEVQRVLRPRPSPATQRQ